MELLLIASLVVPAGLLLGVPTYFVRRYLKLRERQVAALEGARQPGPERLLLEEENRSLRDRIEKLEAIVTSSDFELNRKLAALEVPVDRAGALAAKNPRE
jgi:hypothetical protein